MMILRNMMLIISKNQKKKREKGNEKRGKK